MVLQRPRHNLRRARCLPVDQHHDARRARDQRRVLCVVGLVKVLGLQFGFDVGVADRRHHQAPFGRHDRRAFRDKEVRDVDGAPQQPARVAPQVQDQRAERTVALELDEGGGELGGGVLAEAGERYVAELLVAVEDHGERHLGEHHLLARQHHLLRQIPAVAHQLELHARARFPVQKVGRCDCVQLGHVRAVDRHQPVAHAHALVERVALLRVDDAERGVPVRADRGDLRNRHPHARVLAAHLDPHLFGCLSVLELCEGVERVEHRVEGCLRELVNVNRINVPRVDVLQNLLEQIGLLRDLQRQRFAS
mmetsp:Transcript_10180/g.23831  ORF Transcript_10180/g.23831 Transcript_10180/m.23831 type:complete len:308 (+) Transcript_10180:962-1885(+)